MPEINNNDLDTMLDSLVSAVESLSNNMGDMTSDAANADPVMTSTLNQLQTLNKSLIGNLKQLMSDIKRPDAAGMAGMPGKVRPTPFRSNRSDSTPTADELLSGAY
jgi:ABC-type transporter Mla subunit MlaD